MRGAGLLVLFPVLYAHAQSVTLTYGDSTEASVTGTANLVQTDAQGSTTYIIFVPEPTVTPLVAFESATFIQGTTGASLHAERDSATLDVDCTWTAGAARATCATTIPGSRPTTGLVRLVSATFTLESAQTSSIGTSEGGSLTVPSPTPTRPASTSTRPSGTTDPSRNDQNIGSQPDEGEAEPGSGSRISLTLAAMLGLVLAGLLDL